MRGWGAGRCAHRRVQQLLVARRPRLRLRHNLHLAAVLLSLERELPEAVDEDEVVVYRRNWRVEPAIVRRCVDDKGSHLRGVGLLARRIRQFHKVAPLQPERALAAEGQIELGAVDYNRNAVLVCAFSLPTERLLRLLDECDCREAGDDDRAEQSARKRHPVRLEVRLEARAKIYGSAGAANREPAGEDARFENGKAGHGGGVASEGLFNRDYGFRRDSDNARGVLAEQWASGPDPASPRPLRDAHGAPPCSLASRARLFPGLARAAELEPPQPLQTNRCRRVIAAGWTRASVPHSPHDKRTSCH